MLATFVVLGTLVLCQPQPGSYYDVQAGRAVVGASECPTLADTPMKAAAAIFAVGHEVGHAHDPMIRERWLAYDCGKVGPCEAYADCFGEAHFEQVAQVFGFAPRLILEAEYMAGLGTLGYAPTYCWPDTLLGRNDIS